MSCDRLFLSLGMSAVGHYRIEAVLFQSGRQQQILGKDNATVLSGPLCSYDWKSIRRQGLASIYVIQCINGVLMVSALLVITRTFLRLNNC